MKTLLFTGASGFLGGSILPLLRKEYALKTVGLAESDDFRVNLAERRPSLDARFDIVLHAAGKAHLVPGTPEEEKSFYDVNYLGTIHLCDALEEAGCPSSLVYISTVAVYGRESGELIDEQHPLDGCSPYAESKKLAEQYLGRWCEERRVKLAILRPSLLAGPHAPGNLASMLKAIRRNFFFNVAGGKARKSILMAEDIARLIPLVEDKPGIYNVCDSYHPTFGELSASVARQLGKHRPFNIPYWLAWCMAKCGDLPGAVFPFNSYRLKKMTETLTFSNAKARKELGWEPLDVLTNYRV